MGLLFQWHVESLRLSNGRQLCGMAKKITPLHACIEDLTTTCWRELDVTVPRDQLQGGCQHISMCQLCISDAEAYD